jgi:hypothetical protein
MRENTKIQMAALLLQWIYHSNTWCAIWILVLSLAGPSGTHQAGALSGFCSNK